MRSDRFVLVACEDLAMVGAVLAIPARYAQPLNNARLIAPLQNGGWVAPNINNTDLLLHTPGAFIVRQTEAING